MFYTFTHPHNTHLCTGSSSGQACIAACECIQRDISKPFQQCRYTYQYTYLQQSIIHGCAVRAKRANSFLERAARVLFRKQALFSYPHCSYIILSQYDEYFVHFLFYRRRYCIVVKVLRVKRKSCIFSRAPIVFCITN